MSAKEILEKYNYNLDQIPKELHTKKLCKLAVKKNGYNLKSIQKEFLSYKICKLAVIEKPSIIEYIPEEYMSQELCDIAFSLSKFSIIDFDDSFKTQEMVDEMDLEDLRFYINYLPKRLHTFEIYTKIFNKKLESEVTNCKTKFLEALDEDENNTVVYSIFHGETDPSLIGIYKNYKVAKQARKDYVNCEDTDGYTRDIEFVSIMRHIVQN